jgi:hypothetical protein
MKAEKNKSKEERRQKGKKYIIEETTIFCEGRGGEADKV